VSLDEARRVNAADELRYLMQLWSKADHGVFWAKGWEFTVWSRRGQPRTARLLELSAACSGWWRWDAETYRPVFVAMAEWEWLYAEWKARQP
jgi:hypothetical protein